MLDLDYWMVYGLILTITTRVDCEELSPVKNEESSLEGNSVTLTYKYSKTVTGDQFFWYRQYPGKSPEFLISHYGTQNASNQRLIVEAHGEKVQVQISSAAVSDSAVYYCAVRPAGGSGFKLVFGPGTSLTIEPREEYEPSYYKLEGNGTSACLATGFSRNNGTIDKPLFNPSEAERIHGDSLYNDVVLTGPENQDQCKDSGPVPCEESLQPDPTVNFVSLTVLGLRLLFIKTVIFNVLMTLRLWLRP